MKRISFIPRHVGGKVRQQVLRVRAHREPHSVILLYHRVAEEVRDTERMCVSPKNFAEHMQVLRRLARPVSVEALPQVATGQTRRVSVAVTFDDGYADNLRTALPILERDEVPAAVFIATALVGLQREMWWDELDELVFGSETLPQSLDLPIAQQKGRLSLTPRVRWTESRGPDFGRSQLYFKLARTIRPLEVSIRECVMTQLREWTGRERLGRRSHSIMTPEEVVALATSSLITVGAHSVNHPVLAALPAARQSDEIATSRADLEHIIGRPVSSFSYPYGTLSSYTKTTMRLVREAGFVRACSNFAAPVLGSTNMLELPRLIVRDWDGDEFVRRLDPWLQWNAR